MNDADKSQLWVLLEDAAKRGAEKAAEDARAEAALRRRISRAMKSAKTWSRKELEQRYAWTLVLALEQRACSRMYKRITELRDINATRMELERDAFKDVATQEAEARLEARRSRIQGGRKAHQGSAVSTAKGAARQLWNEAQDGKHPKLVKGSAFAIEAMRRWPVIKPTTLQKWITEWGKERRQSRARKSE